MCALILVCSLANNFLNAEGAKHVADALAVNQTLTSVRYATPRSPNTFALHERQQLLSPHEPSRKQLHLFPTSRLSLFLPLLLACSTLPACLRASLPTALLDASMLACLSLLDAPTSTLFHSAHSLPAMSPAVVLRMDAPTS